jgi:hypothetical protein
MILPLLFVPLVYGMSSTPDACAVPPDSGYRGSYSCSAVKADMTKTCCWRERVPGQILGVEYCQTCKVDSEHTPTDCEQKELQHPGFPEPTPQVPQLFPDGGVLEQPPTTTPPPLFGRNVESIQPTEIIEQPPTTTPTAPPIFGSNIPQGGFEVLQEPETPPMFGQVAPQVAPLTGGNAPLGFFGQEPAEVITPTPTPTPDDGSRPLTGQNAQPGGGVLQEPEDGETEDEPEDDGQEDSSEGAETAGPLS